MYLRYTPEIYKTKALIQVAIKDQPSEFSDLYAFKSSANLNAEIELIKSQKSISRLINKLNLKVFYFSEGEIKTRFLYNSTIFHLENFSVKDPILRSKRIYLKFDGKYISLTNENSEIVYAEYIEPNKFFSSKYLSGIIKPTIEVKDFEKSFESSSKYFLTIPFDGEVKNEIKSGQTLFHFSLHHQMVS